MRLAQSLVQLLNTDMREFITPSRIVAYLCLMPVLGFYFLHRFC